MQCPIDGETLVISERSGVEIDYCPKCRGVWLDRGELDKILERSGEPASIPQQYGTERRSGDHKKKRSSFLGELFDF
ncbi:MAG: zf-TFIIB domain-containing protein [Sulfitobacter sp.]|nr:zf-TFIIB domain-containing protein [Sulfitobacter sp.]